jgi:hypothetical protein
MLFFKAVFFEVEEQVDAMTGRLVMARLPAASCLINFLRLICAIAGMLAFNSKFLKALQPNLIFVYNPIATNNRFPQLKKRVAVDSCWQKSLVIKKIKSG